MTAFEKLYSIYKTQEAIAKAFKVSRQAVAKWKEKGIPLSRAKQVENVTKGAVTIMDIIRG